MHIDDQSHFLMKPTMTANALTSVLSRQPAGASIHPHQVTQHLQVQLQSAAQYPQIHHGRQQRNGHHQVWFGFG